MKYIDESFKISNPEAYNVQEDFSFGTEIIKGIYMHPLGFVRVHWDDETNNIWLHTIMNQRHYYRTFENRKITRLGICRLAKSFIEQKHQEIIQNKRRFRT